MQSQPNQDQGCGLGRRDRLDAKTTNKTRAWLQFYLMVLIPLSVLLGSSTELIYMPIQSQTPCSLIDSLIDSTGRIILRAESTFYSTGRILRVLDESSKLRC